MPTNNETAVAAHNRNEDRNSTQLASGASASTDEDFPLGRNVGHGANNTEAPGET